MKQKNKRSIFKIVVLLSSYYGLLLWVYKNLITARWNYRGFVEESSDESFYLSFIGFFFTVITFNVISKKQDPSAMVMNLFDLLFFIPMYVFVAFKQTASGFFLFLILYQFALFFFLCLYTFFI